MSLLEKMLKAGNIKSASVLSNSDFFKAKTFIPTDLPILNIAFSGTLSGGLLPGLTVIAGASKSFKTMLSLYCVKAYLDQYKDGIAILYDSEFGITPEYISSFDVDVDRVLHIPITNVEELKFDMVQRLEAIDKKDHVCIMIDSIGNLASKKEVEDATNEKSVADMSRAKSLKSLFRIVTPHLTTKNIPCLAINHVYSEMASMYPKTIVSGGCLDGDTKVLMADQTYNRIADIKVGSMVETLVGPRLVTHTWTPDTLEEGTPECYAIAFTDGTIHICSDSHRFIDDMGEWVNVSSLSSGSKLSSATEPFEKVVADVAPIGKRPVYDITVQDAEHYVLQSGLISHNTGIYYSANQIFIITKSQEKDGDDLAGFKFTINIEKSRYVKEKSKLPFTVLFDSGIVKWSALFDLAFDAGFLLKPKTGWYQTIDPETGEVDEKNRRLRSIESDDSFFEKLIKSPKFNTFVEQKYKLTGNSQSTDEILDPDDDEENE